MNKGLEKLFKAHKGVEVKMASEIKLTDLDPISTGSIGLDVALGHPLCYGIVEYAGGEGAGKTTLALEGIANAQKKGFNCFYFNVERALNEKSFYGVDLDLDTLTIINPDTAESISNLIRSIMEQSMKNFIVVDSIPSMVSEKVWSEDASKEFMALTARTLAKLLPQVVNLVEKSKTVLLLINQFRDNLSPYGAPIITPGGKTIRYLCDERILFRTNKSNRIQDKQADGFKGHFVEAEIIKNRFAPPFRKARFPIFYLPGPHIYTEYEVAELAVSFGIVEKAGAWLTLPDGEKVQGFDNLAIALGEDKTKFDMLKQKILEMIK